MTNNFYIYVYLDPRKPGNFVYGEYKFDFEPFYVGKGIDDRFKMHLYESVSKRSTPKLNKIRSIFEQKLVPIIIKIYEGLIEVDAYNLESQIIQIIGRCDLIKGPLVNLTDGGLFEKNKIWTKEERLKISISLKKSEKFQNFIRSDEKKLRTSESLKKYYECHEHHSKGIKKTINEIEKIKNTMSVIYKIKTPDDEILSFKGIKEVTEYFRELNKSLSLKGRFKISSDSILYKSGSKGFKLLGKENDYRDMSCSEITKKIISSNNKGYRNKNSCEYEIKTPDGNILIFIGRLSVKKYFDEKDIKISIDKLFNKGDSNGFLVVNKRKINKLLREDSNAPRCD
jgi:hypothetical protein